MLQARNWSCSGPTPCLSAVIPSKLSSGPNQEWILSHTGLGEAAVGALLIASPALSGEKEARQERIMCQLASACGLQHGAQHSPSTWKPAWWEGRGKCLSSGSPEPQCQKQRIRGRGCLVGSWRKEDIQVGLISHYI